MYLEASYTFAQKGKEYHYTGSSKDTTGDAYLLWRLKLMIADGKIDTQGEIKGMKDFEVKVKESSKNNFVSRMLFENANVIVDAASNQLKTKLKNVK